MEIKEALTIAYELQEIGLEDGYFQSAGELYVNPELLKNSELGSIYVYQKLKKCSEIEGQTYNTDRLLTCVMRFCFYAGAGAYCLWLKEGYAKDAISLISELSEEKGFDYLDEYVTELLGMQFGDLDSKKLDMHINRLIPILGKFTTQLNNEKLAADQLVQCMIAMYDYGILVGRQILG